MRKVLYTKFSRERRNEFQIMTRITEEDGIRRVWKLPLQKEGELHIRHIYENYRKLEHLYAYADVQICPCELDEEKCALAFPFVEGESLETRISRHGKEKDFASLKKDYELLYQIIASAKGQKSFVETDAFCEVFGHPALKEGLAAAEISNIDMIPGNLLLDGEKVWVADYEWVFPFAVPIAFIYARSVFLQEAASALTKEEQEELYAIGGISMEEIPVYYHMEECFQEFAAGKGEPNALATFYGKLHRHNYPLSIWEKEKMMYPVVLTETAPEERELYYEDCFGLDEQKVMMLEKADADGELSLQLMQEGAVIKIRSLAGVCSDGKTECIAFSHNAELEIIDDYYFLGTPVLKFRNAGYEQIRIDYRIYYKGDGVTSQFIQYIRQNKDLRDELNGEIYRKGQLQAEIEAEKAALAHREEELQETRKQKQFLEEELERMRQRKVVRMADKVQHVIKRSK
ncbi:hypothetical protein DW915_04955 [Blautia sp. AM42-2]|uniref:hypothetical protein n=1 Tax=Blautia sp. AM42-2 TaxID=2292976 RepID=UPI000E4997E5|nr:hypothetical protein [Blautia sp. AM42-2]RHS94345.1 hypothetical protein DW915_04955 [Blautia sp. AM42-2]